MAFTPFPWKRKAESLTTPLNPPSLNEAEVALAAQITSGAIALPASVASGSAVTAGRLPIATGSNTWEYATPDQTNPRHAPYFAKFDGNSVTDAGITTGKNEVSSGSYTFVAADVGKKLWVYGAGVASALLYTTITSVSGGKAVLEENAATTVSGAKCYWGTDDTAALQSWLNDLGSAATLARKGHMPHGVSFFTQLVVPNRIDVDGEYWGQFGSVYSSSAGILGESATLLYQLPNTNKDALVFMASFGTTESTGPLSLADFLLQSDVSNISGRGVSLVDSTGTVALSAIDGFRISDVHVSGFASDGFYCPNGSDIFPFEGCRAFNNGGYGLNYVMANAPLSHSLDAVDFSGDQNAKGLIHLEGTGVTTLGQVNVTGLKSEMTAASYRKAALATKNGECTTGSNKVKGLVSTTALYHGASVATTAFPADTYIETVNSETEVTLSAVATETGTKSITFNPGYQVNAIVCDNLGPNVFLNINGIKHIAGSATGTSAPGEAIRINSGTTPQITWNAILVRVHEGQINGNPVPLYDATITNNRQPAAYPYRGAYGAPVTPAVSASPAVVGETLTGLAGVPITNPYGLRRFRALLGDGLNAEVPIVILGDSRVAGENANGTVGITAAEMAEDGPLALPRQFAKLWAPTYGDPGEGFVFINSNIDNRTAESGGLVYTEPGQAAMILRSNYRLTSGATITMAAVPTGITRIGIIQANRSGDVAITWEKNGVSQGALTAPNGTGLPSLQYVTVVAGDIIKLVGPGSGQCTIAGWTLRTTQTSGVVVHRIGRGGYTVGDFMGGAYSGKLGYDSVGAPFTEAEYTKLIRSNYIWAGAKGLLVIHTGGNELVNWKNSGYEGGITPAIYKEGIEKTVAAAVADGWCVLLLGPNQFPEEPEPGQAAYTAMLKLVAENTDHCAMIDHADLWGRGKAALEATAAAGLRSTGSHPTRKGYGDLARNLYRVLSAVVPIGN